VARDRCARWRGGTAVVVVLTAFVARSPAASAGTARASGRRLNVVATVNMWGSIAKQLAGTKASVTSIITNPNTDPHSYEATPADGRTIASARFIIENGVGYDPWAQRLLDANAGGSRAVLNVGQFLGIPADGNPHQWYSPDSVQRFTDEVTADLSRLDRRDRAYFARQHAAFESALAPYHALIAQIGAEFGGTPIGASESIMSPMAAALRLRMLTPATFLRAISEGTDPTAADKTAVDQQIQSKAIKVFVFNSQNSTPDVARLVSAAKHAAIPVTTVTETLAPSTTTFQAWQVRQLQSLRAALQRAVGGASAAPST
jgi:zinc/manganese transport system substrate-binding protein